jgi:Fis family transcriptional regulator, factor for inversion stimulation protein
MKEQLEALIIQMYNSGIRYSESVREFKKSFILAALRENQGNRCKAARQLGMHRNTLSRAITELEVDVKRLRASRGEPTLILKAPAGRPSRIDAARPTGGQWGELMQFQDTCRTERHFGSDREDSFTEQQIPSPYRR